MLGGAWTSCLQGKQQVLVVTLKQRVVLKLALTGCWVACLQGQCPASC